MAFTPLQPQKSTGFTPLPSSGSEPTSTPLDGFATAALLPTKSRVPFPASPDDSPLEAGAKALGNLPKSAYNLAVDTADAVIHPFRTLTALGNMVLGGAQKGVTAATGFEWPDLPAYDTADKTASAAAESMKQRYGSLENLQRTATEDPFGFATEILSATRGVFSAAGKTAQLDRAIDTISKVAKMPPEAIGQFTSKGARASLSQVTSIPSNAIEELIKNPKLLDTPEVNPRVALGQTVKQSLDAKLQDLKDTGEFYKPIRADFKSRVPVEPTFIADSLKKYGFEIDASTGKIIATTKSITRDPKDIQQLQNVVNYWHTKTNLTAEEFMNFRGDLDNLADFDKFKGTEASELISREMRHALNEQYRNYVPGLKEVDAQFEKVSREYKKLEQDYIDPQTGGLSDTALSKLANLTNKGREQVLARLEREIPGVTQRIKELKAIEGIQEAYGLKVGAYSRAVVGGGAFVTGNLPLMIGAILATPEIAVPLIKGYGLTKNQVQTVLNALRRYTTLSDEQRAMLINGAAINGDGNEQQ